MEAGPLAEKNSGKINDISLGQRIVLIFERGVFTIVFTGMVNQQDSCGKRADPLTGIVPAVRPPVPPVSLSVSDGIPSVVFINFFPDRPLRSVVRVCRGAGARRHTEKIERPLDGSPQGERGAEKFFKNQKEENLDGTY